MQLSWAGYSTFVGFVLLLTIAPGPDFAVVMKNALAGGRTAGLWTTVGINISNAVQGSVAALGLGAVIVTSRPVFETIRWAGIAYLCWLGFHTLRSARRAAQTGTLDAPSLSSTGSWRRRLLQGALSNITNPKILVFYLSVGSPGLPSPSRQARSSLPGVFAPRPDATVTTATVTPAATVTRQPDDLAATVTT